MRTLIYHPYFTTRITYLKGSPLASEDLQRAQLRDAVACFVLAPKSYQDSKRADTGTDDVDVDVGGSRSLALISDCTALPYGIGVLGQRQSCSI